MKRARLKCNLSHFCDDANMLHELNDPEGKGLLIQNVINMKTKKKGRRMGYRDMRHSPITWISFCPWCGVSQKEMRKEAP